MITIPQFLDFATDTDNTEIVQGFLKLLELKSHGLFLHSQQVANYAAATAIKMGLPLSEVNSIKTAALLHDIGQLAIPNIILARYPYFNIRERTAYRRHCEAGASMVENIPSFSQIRKIILHHHENWDGSGYPKRLKGVNIPLGSRIIAVANFYDRKCNPCTRQWQIAGCKSPQVIRDLAGVKFDPDAVQAFFASISNPG